MCTPQECLASSWALLAREDPVPLSRKTNIVLIAFLRPMCAFLELIIDGHDDPVLRCDSCWQISEEDAFIHVVVHAQLIIPRTDARVLTRAWRIAPPECLTSVCPHACVSACVDVV